MISFLSHHRAPPIIRCFTFVRMGGKWRKNGKTTIENNFRWLLPPSSSHLVTPIHTHTSTKEKMHFATSRKYVSVCKRMSENEWRKYIKSWQMKINKNCACIQFWYLCHYHFHYTSHHRNNMCVFECQNHLILKSMRNCEREREKMHKYTSMKFEK